MKGIFSFVGFETKWIKYEDAERVKGTSKWKMGSLFAYAADGIMAFSTLPLTLAGLASVLLFAAAIVFMTVCAVNCAGPSKDIRATDVLLVVMMVSSMQMMFIYILGAYVSRDYIENKRRPIYIIKEKK